MRVGARIVDSTISLITNRYIKKRKNN